MKFFIYKIVFCTNKFLFHIIYQTLLFEHQFFKQNFSQTLTSDQFSHLHSHPCWEDFPILHYCVWEQAESGLIQHLLIKSSHNTDIPSLPLSSLLRIRKILTWVHFLLVSDCKCQQIVHNITQKNNKSIKPNFMQYVPIIHWKGTILKQCIMSHSLSDVLYIMQHDQSF